MRPRPRGVSGGKGAEGRLRLGRWEAAPGIASFVRRSSFGEARCPRPNETGVGRMFLKACFFMKENLKENGT